MEKFRPTNFREQTKKKVAACPGKRGPTSIIGKNLFQFLVDEVEPVDCFEMDFLKSKIGLINILEYTPSQLPQITKLHTPN